MERQPLTWLPQYELAWSDSSCDWTVTPEQLGTDHPSLISVHVQPVVFEIIPPATRLNQLTLRFSKYGCSNTAGIRCELMNGDGNVLLSSDHPADSIQDGVAHSVLDLQGIDFNLGQKYWVRLSASGASAGDCFGVWSWRVVAGRFLLPPRITRFRGERLSVWRDDDHRSVRHEELICYAVLASGGNLLDSRNALKLLDHAFPGANFTVLDLGHEEEMARVWPRLAEAHVVAFCDFHVENPSGQTGYDALCFELNRRGTCTIFVDSAGFGYGGDWATFSYTDDLKDLVHRRNSDRRACRYVLQPDEPKLIDNDDIEIDAWEAVGAGTDRSLVRSVVRASKGRLPRVGIASVLYKKADVIDRFIQHVLAQTYPGQIDLVLVDDASPEPDAEIARRRGEEVAERFDNRSVKVVANDSNLGNCQSRLVAISALDCDIYIVIDCDCLINRDFVAAHVFEHGRQDVDAVVGPLNIESGDRDAANLVEKLDADPSLIKVESILQDSVQSDGFVNCITRNFSAKRRVIENGPLFDEDFGYSAKPGSGFGWEDVEMGFRLYASGSVIRFTERAFSVHVTHGSSVAEAGKIAGSFRNFDRLFQKHPDASLAARRWAVDTYAKMVEWAKSAGVDAGEPQRSLEDRFSEAAEAQKPLTLSYRPKARRLRILTNRWHVPHQYELYKLPHDFTLATHTGDNGMVNGWSYDQRPMRENVRLVDGQHVDPTQFDIAIIHFDENILAPSLCNNVIPPSWGDPASWLMAIPDMPKVAICHGTPQFEGQYGLNPSQLPSFRVYEDERERLVRYFADAGAKVVCNSWQAFEEWGFEDCRVIWHGFDPQEFPAGTRTRHILALGADRHRPHYRGAWELAAVQERLDPALKIETAAHYGATMEKRGTNPYAVRHFRSYVDRIRQFTAYLNTTLRSPMPRSRGEAMMTGVIPVALANHDVDRFIENGKNGYYSTEPLELADWLNFLFREPREAARIGANARRTAMDTFNHDRYLTSWTLLLQDALGERVG